VKQLTNTYLSPFENPNQISASNFRHVAGVVFALPPLIPAPLPRHPLLQEAAAVPPRGLRRKARGPGGGSGGCGWRPSVRGAGAAVGGGGGADGGGARSVRDALSGGPRRLAARRRRALRHGRRRRARALLGQRGCRRARCAVQFPR
jgi:hypothetical protein